MIKKTILLGTLLFSSTAFSQVGINTENPKVTLDVTASPTDLTKTDGIIAPRLTGDELKAKDPNYTNDQTGAIVYVTAATSPTTTKTSNVTTAGYYFFDGVIWQKLNGGGSYTNDFWTTTGNSTLATDFIGTLNDQPFNFKINNSTAGIITKSSVSLGYNTLIANTAIQNTAVGLNVLQKNTTGQSNTAYGALALRENVTGNANIAVGRSSLLSNTTGSYNIAIGDNALNNNKASFNTAIGEAALFNNTTGTYNTAVGRMTASGNITGNNNTAIGYNAGPASGSTNLNYTTAIGAGAIVTQNNSMILGGTTAVTAVNVGINTTAPTHKLHIETGGTATAPVAAIKIVDGNQAVGKILTSDANGVGTWSNINLFSSLPVNGYFTWIANTQLGNTNWNSVAYLDVPPGTHNISAKIHFLASGFAVTEGAYIRFFIGKDQLSNTSSGNYNPILGTSNFQPLARAAANAENRDFEMNTEFIYTNTTNGTERLYMNVQCDNSAIQRSTYIYPGCNLP